MRSDNFLFNDPDYIFENFSHFQLPSKDYKNASNHTILNLKSTIKYQ